MSMSVQILLWGIAACLPLVLNLATRRGPDAVGIAGMLLATWCFGRLCWAILSPPESMALYPLVDVICLIIVANAWATRKARWKMVLAGLFLVQLALHAAFWPAWEGVGFNVPRHSSYSLYFYQVANNATFAAELLVTSWGALAHVLDRAFRGVPLVGRVNRHPKARP